MIVYLVTDGGNYSRTVTESNAFLRQVESRKYNMVVSFCYVFHLTIRITFIEIFGIDGMFCALLKCNDVFVGKGDVR